MAKSKIIKDLANGVTSTQVALKRAKILLQEFGNEELMQWVNYELTGYPSRDLLPEYRIKQGQLKGTYFKGSISSHIKYTNVPLPVGKMPKDDVKKLLSVYFCEGVEALAQFLDGSKDQPIGKLISADYYPAIAIYNSDLGMNIVSAQVEVSIQSVQGVLTAVESKLLDLFCYLEKEFGILDELDIDMDSKTAEEQKDIINHISVLIYNDRRVTIGDNNKIKDTTVVSSVE